MNILVISDLHLTNKFDPNLFNKLQSLISDSELVIINGDLWDSYLIKFEEFIGSEWQKLFPILKSKKAIYIFGNHDRAQDSDEGVNLFSERQDLVYEMPWNNKNLHIEHGNLISQSKFEKFPFLRTNKYFFKALITFMELGENILMKLFKPETILRSKHNKLKSAVLSKKEENEIWICGHSHVADYDIENGYINSGIIQFGQLQYIKIDDKEIKLYKENY